MTQDDGSTPAPAPEPLPEPTPAATVPRELMSKADVHREAMMTFRHYDTLSASAVGAIPVSFAGACTLFHSLGDTTQWRFLVPLFGAALVGVLFMLYSRLDLHAHTALKVVACLERGELVGGNVVMGLASTREALDTFPTLKSQNGGTLYRWTRLLACVAAALLLVIAGLSIWELSLSFGW
jgi:hypothetical protein